MSRLFTLILLAACGGAPQAEAPAAPAAAGAHEGHEGHEATKGADHQAASSAKAPQGGWETYGAPFDASEAVTAKALLADPASLVGKQLVVEGEVADVCQKAGCWMVVTDGAQNMRVRMKDHAFSVAKDCTGATARVHGEVVALEVKQDEVQHFEGEAARPEVMPEKQLADGATTTYELVASAVQIKR